MRLVLDLNVSSTLCREGFLRAVFAGLVWVVRELGAAWQAG